MIGQQISHYTVKEKLGSGAYGVVYAAQHEADPELVVAIKVIQPSLIDEPKFVASLKAECRRLSKLDHPAIVRFRDLVVGEDMVAMILEHLDGQDLHGLIRAGDVSLARAVGILEACLEGLAYAHSRQVVHRDIKPSNIFVCNDGRIKLLDFGLARAAQSSQATQTRTLKGTLNYMAPERFSAGGGGPRSDVYALGLVAWELLTGRPACPAGDLPAKLGWHLGVGAVDVRIIRPDVPNWLADVVGRLVAMDPAERPASAGEAKALFEEQKAAGSLPSPQRFVSMPVRVDSPFTVELDVGVVADTVAGVERAAVGRAAVGRAAAGRAAAPDSVLLSEDRRARGGEGRAIAQRKIVARHRPDEVLKTIYGQHYFWLYADHQVEFYASYLWRNRLFFDGKEIGTTLWMGVALPNAIEVDGCQMRLSVHPGNFGFSWYLRVVQDWRSGS
jgi:hypothetical protein